MRCGCAGAALPTGEVINIYNDLTEWVAAELDLAPNVDREHIAVSADGAVVTLRGTVASPWQKQEAQNAALRVSGVRGIRNELQVRKPDGERRSDAELRAAVIRALVLDSSIPGTVDATVQGGLVTLFGTAEWPDQREQAHLVCSGVEGVMAVKNEISLTLAPRDVDI
jgi:osmotically-inducible protein OsmY